MSRRRFIACAAAVFVACVAGGILDARLNPPKAAQGSVQRKYGFHKPTSQPAKSQTFAARHGSAASNPAAADLRALDVPIYNQGPLGSCTSNGWCAAIEFYFKNRVVAAVLSWWQKFLHFVSFGWYDPKSADPDYFEPSRLAYYYDERSIEGTVGADNGASVATGAKVAAKIGVAPETLWPYDTSKFRVKPPRSYYDEAARHRLPEAVSVDLTNIDEIETAISHGHPIVFGFDVYASFESVGADGVYRPAGRYLGGHCVELVGYDHTKQLVIVRNSWGEEWGDKGYFYASYSWITSQQCSDGWALIDDASPQLIPLPDEEEARAEFQARPDVFPAPSPAVAATPRKKAA